LGLFTEVRQKKQANFCPTFVKNDILQNVDILGQHWISGHGLRRPLIF
jgi:hypothetical protein